MPKGFLTVHVSNAGEAVPIENAAVRIYTRKTEEEYGFTEEQVIEKLSSASEDYLKYTDSSGRTETVSIDAPEIEISFTEGTGVLPFSLCDVVVEKENFFSAIVFGVQIFPGIESILPVNLQPFTNALTSNIRATPNITGTYGFLYIIPFPAVETGANRDAVIYRDETVFIPYVSEDVYIPEYITVHLGRPTDNAENVYVPFPDYIKNVASSEIFPTWPESAIRANIYAQISIALNRVYTEWYPSQGYDFQITNSTAFDQAFVKGRNYYSNIEKIVDEIFNTFIRRDGAAEPLFATYCDGRRTSCDGMTQWGSYELANAGYVPISILRSYYGDDISLVSTNDIRGIESTYGGVPLVIGDASNDVAVIQRQLNRIREDYPAIPLIAEPNGVFGSDTDAAVRRFQSIFGLTVDGVVGKATWYRISYLYVSVKKLSELTSEGQNPSFPQRRIDEELSYGDRGDDVRTLQYLLSYISLFYDTVQSASIDGIFGTDTQNSLISFQKAFALTQTGTTDEQTRYTLYAVYEAILSSIYPLEEEQRFSGSLSVGSAGEDVRLVQRYLNTLGQYYDVLEPLTEDGVFGQATADAVMEFQRLYGFDETGIVNGATWLRLVELYNYIRSRTAES